jgi:hypothetical protein
MPKSININQEVYYSVPEAAELGGVSRMTMLRWITRDISNNATTLKVVKDPINNRYYIAAESVAQLAKRFRRVDAQS